MLRFWWGHKENQSRTAWLSLRKMGRAKLYERLGYRDLEAFNQALLAKQGARMLRDSDSLVVRVMKEKYFPNTNFLDSRLGSKPSYAWKSIWNAIPLLSKGLLWRIGDWRMIKIW
jgi:hypothetical protein